MNIGLDGAYAIKSGSDKDNFVERSEYVAHVIETLATDYPQSRLFVYTPKLSRKTRLNLIDDLHNAEYRLPAPSGFTGRMWCIFGITNCLQADKVEVYHGLNGELPLNISSAHVPAVVTVRESDIALFDAPLGLFEVVQKIRRYILRNSWRNATFIIVSSEEHKSTLMKRFAIEESKIEVIPVAGHTAVTLMSLYQKAIASCGIDSLGHS